MKMPNGYGGITKLPGRRRNPYRAQTTSGWKLVDGKAKQLRVTIGYFATKKEAIAALTEYNRHPRDLTQPDATFAECYQGWSPKHYEQYPKAAVSLSIAYKKCAPIENMAIKDIRLKHMQDIMDAYSDLTSRSQGYIKTVFANTFKYAMENDIVQKDYSKFVKIKNNGPKKDITDKFFTAEEITKLLECDLPMADVLIILLYTGMRIGELLSLKCEDIDLEKRLIHVRGTKTKAADRIVPIHRDIAKLLEARLGNEYLIHDEKHGGQMKVQRFRTAFFTPIMEDIGADHTPHALRHTFISIMDACGVPASSVTLKRIVGHSNSSITEHYTHKETRELILAIDKFRLSPSVKNNKIIPLANVQ